MRLRFGVALVASCTHLFVSVGEAGQVMISC